jgi:anti-anti-sigma regulatory factor
MAHVEPLIIRLEKPEWDLNDRQDLIRLIEPALTHPDVILDISAVTYLDSTALRQFSTMIPSPHVRRIFEIVHFDAIWPIFNTLEAALASAQPTTPSNATAN